MPKPSTAALSPAAAPANDRDALLPSLCLCLGLSGAAALIYQVAWTRQFALVFGTSELAVATVLAAFMGGLALGAMSVERLLPRMRRPLRWYAGLELGIALTAVLLPAGLWLSQFLLLRLFGAQAAPPASAGNAQLLFYVASAFLVLLLPTALMGATLPVLARTVVHADAQIGTRVGILYACNTLGAVGGALLTALLLLPALGLERTVLAAAGMNVAAALLAAALARRPQAQAPNVAAPSRLSWCLPGPAWVLPLMLLSGAVSFVHEVLWTRVLSHLLGSSLYAFGVMLASFLAGIALGGATGAALARERSAAMRWLILVELAVAGATAAAWFTLQHGTPSQPALAPRILFGVIILMPLAFAIGATYPLAVRVLAADASDSGAASARVYAWNTAGAIVGALAGGFVLIPALRYEGAVQCAFIGSCALALAAALLLTRLRLAAIAAVAAVAVLAAVLFQPQPPTTLLLSSPLLARSGGTLLYYGVGRSATVAVIAQDDRLFLRTNGLPEAGMSLRGAPPQFNGEAWMPALAVLARPTTVSMLVVGYGAGRTIEAVPPSVDAIDVIELEPKVIDANRSVAEQRSTDPLLDSRVNLILNDARGALALSSKRYDAVVSQPSHPWTAGASHLYTREFMQQVHKHLNTGGVFVQWLNVNYVDAELLRSLLATLADVFADVRLYRPDADTLLFLASDAPLAPEHDLNALRATLERAPRHYLKLGMAAPEDVVGALRLENRSVRQLAQGAALITDDRNRLATARVFDRHEALTPAELGGLLAPYDPLQQRDSFIYGELDGRLDFDYLARRLQGSGDAARLRAIAAALPASPQRAYVQAFAAATGGMTDAAVQQQLVDALAMFPNDDALRYEYIRPELDALAAGQAAAAVARVAATLGPQPTAVLTAAAFAQRQQWDQVAALDPTLALVPPTAPWSRDAVQLRAEWRIHVPPAARAQTCAEAVRIIDEAVPLERNAPLLALRAWAGVGLQSGAVVLESLSSLAAAVMQAPANGPVRARLHDLILPLQRLLAALEHASGVETARWLQVQQELARAERLTR